jgi:glycosyltransferase involved in cell wall biosynthesis
LLYLVLQETATTGNRQALRQMNPFQKAKVVIASTLKPVDDVRLYRKIALTLVDSGRFDVHMIGTGETAPPHVTADAHSRPNRISLTRAALSFRILRNILKLKPDILIIATHELLVAAAVFKLVTGKPVIYDVQENYFLNIRHTHAFPILLRWPVATWVRLKEVALTRFIDKFLLAEKGFIGELRFAGENGVVIENKALVPPGFKRTPANESIRLLFSGTIDESTGVFDAISLAERLHKANPAVTLHIIGFCPRISILERLRESIAEQPYITLTGGDHVQPHKLIEQAIKEAHFGLICYRPSPHINNRMPTKLYEYLAYRLPILIRNDLWWCNLVTKARAGIAVDFGSSFILPDTSDETKFYPGGKRNLTYEFDKVRLLEIVDDVVARGRIPLDKETILI